MKVLRSNRFENDLSTCALYFALNRRFDYVNCDFAQRPKITPTTCLNCYFAKSCTKNPHQRKQTISLARNLIVANWEIEFTEIFHLVHSSARLKMHWFRNHTEIAIVFKVILFTQFFSKGLLNSIKSIILKAMNKVFTISYWFETTLCVALYQFHFLSDSILYKSLLNEFSKISFSLGVVIFICPWLYVYFVPNISRFLLAASKRIHDSMRVENESSP